MSILEQKILEEIIKNQSNEKIKSKYNLTDKQLYYYVKLLINKGYCIDRISDNHGIMKYYMNQKITTTKQIVTDNNIIKMLAISDLHFTNKNDYTNYLDQVYEYAIKKNIHIIINLGDIIEGTKTGFQKPGYETVTSQIDYLLKNYPYDSNVANYFLLGNHDVHSISTDGINISQILMNERPDFIYCGTKNAILQISNILIGLFHSISTIPYSLPNNYISFTLKGHRHQFMICTKSNDLSIYVPTLSNVAVGDRNEQYLNIGFLDITIDLQGIKTASLDIIYYDIENKIKESGRFQTKIKKIDKIK